MPITVGAEIRSLSQTEFGDIAFKVMEHVFEIHNAMGRFLDEGIYKQEIAFRTGDALIEVPINVTFDDFGKQYFVDLLVAGGAPFELKVVSRLTQRHRSQLLNYLLLAGLSHGKLVNLRTERVEHEFLNASLKRTDRTQFAVQLRGCEAGPVEHQRGREWLISALRDWGTCLDIKLYEAALTHFFGGEERIFGETDIVVGKRRIGRQKVRLANPDTAFKITAIHAKNQPLFEDHTRRFLNHSSLRRILWINVTRSVVTFTDIVN